MIASPMRPQPPHTLYALHSASERGSTPSMASAITATAPAASEGSSNNTLSKRPKLSLQTTALPVSFGKSTTGLSLALTAGQTASPTVSNTFNNAYPASAGPPATHSKHIARYITSEQQPYQQPLGLRSILRNSPLPRCNRRRSSLPGTGTNGTGARRVLFPAKKQVTYRLPLEEEITTVHYVAKHSDLSSDESASVSSSEPSSDEDSDGSSSRSSQSTSDEEAVANGPVRESHSRKKRRKVMQSRQVRAAAERDGFDGDETPRTPVDGRRKRRRAWRWTLGPLEHDAAAQTAPKDTEQSTAILGLMANALAFDDQPKEVDQTAEINVSHPDTAPPALSPDPHCPTTAVRSVVPPPPDVSLM